MIATGMEKSMSYRNALVLTQIVEEKLIYALQIEYNAGKAAVRTSLGNLEG